MAKIGAMTTSPLISPELLYRPAGSGATFLGPGDVYRFLITGAESGGAYFAMEAFVPPGGGPPPHIHRNEDETFYIVEGRCDFLLGDETITGGPGVDSRVQSAGQSVRADQGPADVDGHRRPRVGRQAGGDHGQRAGEVERV